MRGESGRREGGESRKEGGGRLGKVGRREAGERREEGGRGK